MASTLAFLRQYLRPRPGIVVAEPAVCRRGDELLPATVYRPAGAHGARPGWVVLHGLTYHGREHPSLVKFAAAVAASGAVVVVPDIPEWTRLRVAPHVTGPSIHAGVAALRERRDVAADRIGVIGFSFGATQALVAAADPALAAELRGVAAWGGYADVGRLFHFGITGEYDWQGATYHEDPDPYGRWIMGGNYLTAIPGYEGFGDTARALHRLAIAAGQAGIYAADAHFDPLKLELRATLSPAEQDVYDLFAPLTTETHKDMARATRLAQDLAAAAVRTDPMLDPSPYLPRVAARTFVAHGRDDRLVPFTEAFRVSAALPPRVLRKAVITSLFSHSGGTRRELSRFGVVREGVRFVALLHGILDLV
ncbi:MAG TPA: hypothetical protein VFQ38_06420 [Longimicrobiales bacterium]|nr:hypothetical protein [Longimicrobiales bacterium]